MKKIRPSRNKHRFPRNPVKSVEARGRDLIIRLTDWTDDDPQNEPGFDVEVYIGGVYDWNESQTFGLRHHAGDKNAAKSAAIRFAQEQTEKIMRAGKDLR